MAGHGMFSTPYLRLEADWFCRICEGVLSSLIPDTQAEISCSTIPPLSDGILWYALNTDTWTSTHTAQREDVYKHFRFTSRTALLSFTGLVLIPVTFYCVASSADVRPAFLDLQPTY